jgi:hypothetical protein
MTDVTYQSSYVTIRLIGYKCFRIIKCVLYFPLWRSSFICDSVEKMPISAHIRSIAHILRDLRGVLFTALFVSGGNPRQPLLSHRYSMVCQYHYVTLPGPVSGDSLQPSQCLRLAIPRHSQAGKPTFDASHFTAVYSLKLGPVYHSHRKVRGFISHCEVRLASAHECP